MTKDTREALAADLERLAAAIDPPQMYVTTEKRALAAEVMRAASAFLMDAPAVPVQPKALTMPIEAIREWAERHDLRGSEMELRCIFEDAQTLHMCAQAAAASAAPTKPEGYFIDTSAPGQKPHWEQVSKEHEHDTDAVALYKHPAAVQQGWEALDGLMALADIYAKSEYMRATARKAPSDYEPERDALAIALRAALAPTPQAVRLVEGLPRDFGQRLDSYGEHKDRP
jgi:hypothetical protein